MNTPPQPSLVGADTVLARAAEHLADTYRGVFSVETILRCIAESYQLLASTARIQTHLPNLAIRFATERLAATAKIKGGTGLATPHVLFVCTHNAGRSQLAAALLEHRAGGQVIVRSAGSAPADQPDPGARHALAEIGIDVTHAFTKPLTDETIQAADVVVLMGCHDACPIYPGKRYLNWDLPDPAGRPLDQIRLIRDDIDRRVQALLAELTDGETRQ